MNNYVTDAEAAAWAYVGRLAPSYTKRLLDTRAALQFLAERQHISIRDAGMCVCSERRRCESAKQLAALRGKV